MFGGKFALLCILVLFSFFETSFCRPPTLSRTGNIGGTTKTDWDIRPSFMLDTVCVLNVLTGDPYYVAYYKNEYEKLRPQITPSAQKALTDLKRKIKDEQHGIISAYLALYFSVTDDRTLDDMLRTVKDSSRMKTRLQKTIYYSDKDWRLYESVRDDLREILWFLKAIHFDRYWTENAVPKVNKKIVEIRSELPKYDVVSEIEKLFGFTLPTNKITVNILYFSQPHGIRVTGLRFLTDASYPFKIVLRNAVHEPMHPPFDLAKDKELRDALDVLRNDEFLMDKVGNHNKSFGYNSFEGFVEEDCVQALELLICEKLGVANEPHARWKKNDDGMHVLAVALYALMKTQNFNGEKEHFRSFLIRNIKNGQLAPGSIKTIVNSFYAPQ